MVIIERISMNEYKLREKLRGLAVGTVVTVTEILPPTDMNEPAVVQIRVPRVDLFMVVKLDLSGALISFRGMQTLAVCLLGEYSLEHFIFSFKDEPKPELTKMDGFSPCPSISQSHSTLSRGEGLELLISYDTPEGEKPAAVRKLDEGQLGDMLDGEEGYLVFYDTLSMVRMYNTTNSQLLSSDGAEINNSSLYDVGALVDAFSNFKGFKVFYFAALAEALTKFAKVVSEKERRALG